MYPWEVIALRIILHRQLPIGLEADLERRIAAAMMQRDQIEFREAPNEIDCSVAKFRCRLRHVDEDHIQPNIGAHLKETELLALDLRVGIVPGATDMRRHHQFTIETVAP